MILALLLLSMPPEEASLRTLLHRLELQHWAAWKAGREGDEEAERREHNAAGL